MKSFITIFFYLTTLYSIGNETIDYKVYFKDEIIDATKYIKCNNKIFTQSCKKYKHNKNEVVAIIYPELLRYNYLKDFFETSSLDLVYVNYGSKAADFSIGHFQMKPSFVEQLEKYSKSHSKIGKKYKHLFINDKINSKEKRKIIVKRLKNIYWQLAYLHIFIDICFDKFPMIQKEKKHNQIHFIAACYNNGFNFSFITLKKRSALKIFPFGTKYNGSQFCYADISCAYYNHKVNK
jgi:hypothetical protein